MGIYRAAYILNSFELATCDLDCPSAASAEHDAIDIAAAAKLPFFGLSEQFEDERRGQTSFRPVGGQPIPSGRLLYAYPSPKALLLAVKGELAKNIADA